jgi:hypothetical protein
MRAKETANISYLFTFPFTHQDVYLGLQKKKNA